MAQSITTLTSANFDETIGSSDTPILVDFWAPWCGPCLKLSPILDEIATEQAGNITIAKINIDDYGDIAARFNVMSIPTLIVFNKGDNPKRLAVPAWTKGKVLQELAEFLPNSH
jgi:thioredoxin 1